jgi:Zinc carboxypeptidase
VSLRGVLLGAVLAALLACAPAASASQLLSARIASTKSAFRACSDRPATGKAGNVQRRFTAPKLGWVTAKLEGSGGDWDLAVFDASTNRLVAGDSGFTADEVASGIAQPNERLIVQACRLSGSGSKAKLNVSFSAIDASKTPPTLSLVRVSVPNRARKDELTRLGLDLTENGGKDFVDVVLHGAADAKRLRDHKFVYVNKVADIAKQTVADAAKDSAYAKRVRASALPSGRTSYRRLPDYGADMKKLVRENPDLVKPITLPFKTWTGRTVDGIEITQHVNAADGNDGKPVFLQMGVHHAREWPAGEHAIEWAFELVKDYKAGDPRTRSIMARTRTIVVPIVNPDGFNTSREAGETAGAGGGRGGSNETANLAIPYEYQRKNCRTTNPDPNGDDPPSGDCNQQPATGLEQFGTDPNRNYGGFWGGDGATPPGGNPPGEYAQDYRGNGPFSEPETQNIRSLISRRQVTTLITNHTFSDLVLRPPGIQRQGPPVDEAAYKALGDSFARENGYTSEPSYQLYDTTGSTEDWSYYATGGFGFTFEIGLTNFHPPYADTVAQYDGTAPEATNIGGHGNREAYFKAEENTGNTGAHSVLAGKGPSGSVLRLHKDFKTATSPVKDAAGNRGGVILFDDHLDTTMEPTASTFQWHINPSTRPIAAQAKGRPATGSPSPPITQNGITSPTPPCPTYPDSCLPGAFKDVAFDVPPNGGGVDNSFANIRIAWAEPGSDFDLYVYRDADGDGNSANDGNPIASSASGTTSSEETAIGPDIPAGKYVARVVNFAAVDPTFDFSVTFEGPEPFKAATTETWRLTCESFGGTVLTSQDVLIGRGQTVDPGLQKCTAAFNRAFATGKGCDKPTGRVRRTTLDRTKLGRDRLKNLKRFKIGRRSRGSVDRFCFTDKRALRIGYPSKQLRKKFGPKNRKRFKSNKGILVLTSSKKFKVGKLRVGSRARGLRHGLKVGRNRWYVKRGSKAMLVYKVRRKKVYEVGLADKTLTKTRGARKRFFKSFH